MIRFSYTLFATPKGVVFLYYFLLMSDVGFF